MEEGISRLEEELVEAIATRNALRYFEICEELGRNPDELPELFYEGFAKSAAKKGFAETTAREEFVDRYAQTDTPQGSNPNQGGVYARFHKEGGTLRRGFEEDYSQKRELLKKYFPKFRNDGRQPIGKMSAIQVGSLFDRLMKQAER